MRTRPCTFANHEFKAVSAVKFLQTNLNLFLIYLLFKTIRIRANSREKSEALYNQLSAHRNRERVIYLFQWYQISNKNVPVGSRLKKECASEKIVVM